MDFIAETTAREFSTDEFYNEFGWPETQERAERLVFLYDCLDASVELTIDREKFDRGVIDVVEVESY